MHDCVIIVILSLYILSIWIKWLTRLALNSIKFYYILENPSVVNILQREKITAELILAAKTKTEKDGLGEKYWKFKQPLRIALSSTKLYSPRIEMKIHISSVSFRFFFILYDFTCSSYILHPHSLTRSFPSSSIHFSYFSLVLFETRPNISGWRSVLLVKLKG